MALVDIWKLLLRLLKEILDFKEKRTISFSAVSQCLQQTAVTQYRALTFLATVHSSVVLLIIIKNKTDY